MTFSSKYIIKWYSGFKKM